MGSLFDYLLWRGDLTLEKSPFNPVDNVILSHLSYLPLSGIVPGPEDGGSLRIGEAVQFFTGSSKKMGTKMKRRFMFKEDPELLLALGSSLRFRDMGLTGFVSQHDPVEEKQFAALTVLSGDGSIFVTYRGTDDTFVGWKEDFKLTFSDEIPSQIEAVKYLEKMAGIYRKPLRIGGHSKGGNLSVYAASYCSKKVRNRISGIYINDAPGFSDKVITSEGYLAVRKKIMSYIPESSVVGMLFERDYDNTVVKSTKVGILQHDIYTWEVMGNDFVRVEGLKPESRFIDRTVRDWMASLDKEQLREFTEALFTILGSAEVNSFYDLGVDWVKSSMAMIQSFGRIEGHSRDMFVKALLAFFKAAQNNIRILLPEDKGRRTAIKVKSQDGRRR